MTTCSRTQLVRNQLLIREVNERIAEVLHADRDDAMEFLCECSDANCIETIALSYLEYKGIRSNANLFSIVRGHESPAVDRIVQEHEHFTLVEKKERLDLVVRDELGTGS